MVEARESNNETKKVLVSFSRKLSKEPVISKTILATKTIFNILKAEVSSEKSELIGEIVGSEKQAREFIAQLKKAGAEILEIDALIKFDEEKCVQCTYCSCLCPSKAIVKKGDEIEVNLKNCILCKACVENCPVRAFSLLGV